MNKTHMTPNELEQAMLALYGTTYGSQRKLAEAVGRHEVSISRWMHGAAPIDASMAKLIRALVREKQGGNHQGARQHKKAKPRPSLMEMM